VVKLSYFRIQNSIGRIMSQLNVMYLIFEETIGNLILNINMKKPQKVVCEYVGHRSTYIEH
jgi:hypothetical protein